MSKFNQKLNQYNENWFLDNFILGLEVNSPKGHTGIAAKFDTVPTMVLEKY